MNARRHSVKDRSARSNGIGGQRTLWLRADIQVIKFPADVHDGVVRLVHILHVVGARPNFMKAAPVLSALQQKGAKQALVHTGQHLDANMSEIFFSQPGMPQPDIKLEVGAGSHALQTAEIRNQNCDTDALGIARR